MSIEDISSDITNWESKASSVHPSTISGINNNISTNKLPAKSSSSSALNNMNMNNSMTGTIAAVSAIGSIESKASSSSSLSSLSSKQQQQQASSQSKSNLPSSLSNVLETSDILDDDLLDFLHDDANF
jgi:hypothetical protein